MVTCHGDHTYTFALGRPVTWQIPHGYGVNSGSGATSSMVESYAKGEDSVEGVTVMEGVRAAAANGQIAAGVPATADGFVHWLAARPYLDASPVRQTRLDGRNAWHVRVSLKPHAGDGPALCLNSTTSCHAMTSDPTVTGIWGDMTADYTAIDLPGSGTAVVWSWAFAHDTAALARNRQVVAGLSWPTR